MTQIDWFFGLLKASQSCTETFYDRLNHGLEFCNRSLREKRVQRCPPQAMLVMWHGPKMGRRIPKHRRRPGPFISSFCWTSINLVVVLWVVNVQLIWVDPDYGPWPKSATQSGFERSLIWRIPYVLCISRIFQVYLPRWTTS